jgi:hypothetical protein
VLGNNVRPGTGQTHSDGPGEEHYRCALILKAFVDAVMHLGVPLALDFVYCLVLPTLWKVNLKGTLLRFQDMLHDLFYCPQNAIYFSISSFSVQMTRFINHVRKFKY